MRYVKGKRGVILLVICELELVLQRYVPRTFTLKNKEMIPTERKVSLHKKVLQSDETWKDPWKWRCSESFFCLLYYLLMNPPTAHICPQTLRFFFFICLSRRAIYFPKMCGHLVDSTSEKGSANQTTWTWPPNLHWQVMVQGINSCTLLLLTEKHFTLALLTRLDMEMNLWHRQR